VFSPNYRPILPADRHTAVEPDFSPRLRSGISMVDVKRRWFACVCWLAAGLACASSGCAGGSWFGLGRPGPAKLPVGSMPNPLLLAVPDREFLHNQVVDELDNYFKIDREERVRQVGGVLTEGRIETFPAIGSTLLEPWRKDSTPGFEKLHSTLQSVRRRAVARIVPSNNGYLIDLAVYKELEDLPQPENATVGGATIRHDSSLVRNEEQIGLPPGTLGWIPLGRDVTLEQQVLANIRNRVTDVGPPRRLPAIQTDLNVEVKELN
jgi:hypothetical protein